jgi:hypothetical protein
MKKFAIILGISLGVGWVILASLSMAQDGFIKPLPPEPPDKDLPPEAQNLPREVLHQVSSKENLHLLAGYYYGDPRQWKKIYRANRHRIRNPNRLEPGQLLRIPVAKNWSPRYNYEEWIQLAQRGGEWVPRSKRGLRVVPSPMESGGKEEPSFKREVPTLELPPLEKEKPGTEAPPSVPPTEMQPSEEKKEGSQL